MRIEGLHRLEPRPGDRDLQAGFQAAIFDPLWSLARQWQLGEHQGENATSPVAVHYTLRRSPMHAPQGFEGDPRFDPSVTPVEAIIESEVDDWWTMGRRIRVGAAVAGALALDATHTDNRDLLLDKPAAPYDAFHGRFDGRALWRRNLGRDQVPASDAPPAEGPFTWRSESLDYRATIPSAAGPFVLPHHRGGRVDWHSAEALPDEVPDEPAAPIEDQVVFPTPFEYPGAPHSRWWQIENAAVDLGGYPPDPAHFPTMLLLDMVSSHGDDWFVFPVNADAASFVQLELRVRDAFGTTYRNEVDATPKWPGLRPPDEWSLLRTTGQRDGMTLFLTAATPLEGQAVEEVQFGLDEYSNRLWAVERRLDGQHVQERAGHDEPPPRLNAGTTDPDRTAARDYAYIPANGTEPHWHPYELVEVDGARRFVQHGFADLSRTTPHPMPYPAAETLLAGTPEARELQHIIPAAIPSNGLVIERRWILARDTAGRPVLWIQRQRKPLLSPPGRTVRFDVLEEHRRPPN